MPKRIIMSEGKSIEVIEELKSSGNWTVPKGCRRVDVFLVGGGAGGEYGGGGSGYTKIFFNVPVTPGQIIEFIIGVGGSYGGMSINGANGGFTQFLNSNYRAEGGKTGLSSGKTKDGGGDGGSGGSGYSANIGGGGRDGSDGKTTDFIGGIGQHSTTRAFGEPTGKLFSSGGDAASTARQHAEPNTGNGGNGHGHYGGNGGSGIIILRYKKHEL